jgi:hypothetical protein
VESLSSHSFGRSRLLLAYGQLNKYLRYAPVVQSGTHGGPGGPYALRGVAYLQAVCVSLPMLPSVALVVPLCLPCAPGLSPASFPGASATLHIRHIVHMRAARRL